VAFVEDGVNFGEEPAIFVNSTSITLTFAKSDPVVALLGLDYTCVQTLVQIASFLVNLPFDLNDLDLCHMCANFSADCIIFGEFALFTLMTLTFAKSDPGVARLGYRTRV
jgi:hypothetical protein